MSVVGAVLGWSVLLAAAGALSFVVFRGAKQHGILAPLFVGLLLRLAVMLIAHVGSVSLGDHGFLFIDDQTYMRGGSRLADLWSAGHAPDPSRVDILGTYQFGYQVALGAIFTLSTTSLLLGKLVNVLIGTASILVVALLGGRLLGERAKLRAAWLVALAPSLVWWSAPLLKEALATLLVALGLLAITYLPRPRAVVGLSAVLAFMVILRGPAALALVAGAGLAIALAGRRAERKWLSRPLVTYGLILLAGMVVVGVVVSRGNLHNLYSQYDFVVHNMIEQYQGGNPIRIPFDAVKSLVTPLPWVLDRGTENWDRALFPGVWVLMCALPLAVIGAWRLRHRPEAWALFGTAATALSINSATSGFVFRQRSMIEPLIFLFALAGTKSWQMAARTAAATLGVVAVAAGIQSRSPLVVAMVAAAAAALLLISRRLPATPFEAAPPSPMVAAFTAGADARAAAPAPSPAAPERVGPSIGTRAAQAFAPVARAVGSALEAVRSLAPRLETRDAPDATRTWTSWQGPKAAWTALLAGAPPAGAAPSVRWLRTGPATAAPSRPAPPPPDSGAPPSTEPAVPQAPEEGTASPAGGYRPALDGVRAVAVLAVIAYHYGSNLPGGFLGVDVFFVLSGYLITSLLLSERVRTGGIGFARFWARRARRLLPAVLILVVVVALVTSQIAPINTLAARRDDMIATLLYYANWHFIAVGQSYFAQFGGVSPLEHMWSLAIEEQFYLLWPLIVMAALTIWRGRTRPLLWLIGIGAVISAARMISLYDVADPTRTYFGTDTRAHALLVGALLATVIYASPRLLASERVREAAAWTWPLVVGLIGLSFLEMKDQVGFYYQGGAFLFAVLVAAMLLVVEAIPQSVPGKLLSLRPVRWVGMISYGLYLWHWPMVVWLPHSKTLALLLTFAVATASFYLVERPIRSGRAPWLGRSTRRLAFALPVALFVVSMLVVQSTRIGSNPIALQVNDVGAEHCPAGSPTPAPGFAWCSRVEPTTARAPVVATAGDSTVLALDSGLRKLAGQRGWGYIQAGKNGCSVLPLVFPSSPDDPASVASARACIPGIPRLLANVEAERHPDVWLISDRWSTLPLLDRDGRTLQPGDARRRQLLEAAWRARLKALTAHGAKVVILITPPQGPPVECATQSPPPASCGSDAYSTGDPQTAAGRAVVRAAAARFPQTVAAVSVDDIVCPGGRCPAVVGGVLTRYDGIHYTATFSSRVLDAIFRRAKRAGIVG